MTRGGPDHQGSLPGATSAEAAALAQLHGLERAGVRPPLRTYLAEVWRRRSFVWALAEGQFIAKHQNNYLGLLWSVLNPLLLGLSYFLIFGLLLRTDRGVDNYIGFLTVGLFVFLFISSALTTGAKALVSNTGMIRALQFPRVILPLTVVTTELLATTPAFLTLLLIALATGEPVRVTWLLFPVALFIVYLMCLGLALLCARLLHGLRDAGNIIPLITRLLRYVSGVFFSIEAYGSGWTGAVLQYQPIAAALSMVRQTLLSSDPLHWQTWAAGTGWAVALLVAGLVVFWRGEATYGRT